jgi:membrane-associated phospholipid phosphatase
MLRRPRSALFGALGCLAGLALTGAVSHLVPAARVKDTASLKGFASLGGSGLDGALNGVAHLIDPGPYLILSVSLVLVAVQRRRRRLALVVPAVLLIAPVTTELLKHITAERRGTLLIARHVAEASWPSGHSTGAMTIALCAVLVSPPRLRPLVATIGGLFAVAVAYAVVVLIWHFPSDVIGGYLVAAGWTLVAVAALRRWPDRPLTAPGEEQPEELQLGPPLAVAAVAAVVGVVLAFQRRGALADQFAQHPSFVIAAAAIAALAAGLAALLVRSASSE